MANTPYPFTAVVGQDQLKLALILTAISPRIGGVVVRGEKGTAKTTTARGFAALMPQGQLVNLPLGATEDRVVGSLDLEKVLTTGQAEFRPGLLSEANGGILYVDEVNLLSDHLVDVLLDAAATGRVTVERDSISHTEEARFVLVGTMNPEEGELRPQLLDRFGLAVDVVASHDVAQRVGVIQRRMAFEADPEAFVAKFAEPEAAVERALVRAQEIVQSLTLSATNLKRIATVCAGFDVDGMRADLVIARAAAAHAAWRLATASDADGSDNLIAEVTDTDIRAAAELALPHRMRRNPFDSPELDQDRLDELMNEPLPEDDPEPDPEEEDGDPGRSDSGEGDGDAADDSESHGNDENTTESDSGNREQQSPATPAPDRETSATAEPSSSTGGVTDAEPARQPNGAAPVAPVAKKEDRAVQGAPFRS